MINFMDITVQTGSDFCNGLFDIIKLLVNVVNILKWIIPMGLILYGLLDLGKAVMAGEDKKIKEAQKTFLMRLIYGIAVFFIFVIVEVIFGLLGVETNEGDSKICWDCATKPHNKSCLKYVEVIEEKEPIYDSDNEEENQNKQDETYDKEEV